MGHLGPRVEGVLDAERLRGHQLPAGLDPVAGAFVRVGAIALNAVLAADIGLGDTVVIVGQGVIGLLATAYAKQSGATVIAVDGIAGRRELARAWGADEVFAPSADVASTVRELTRGRGADVAIDLSGVYPALNEAIRMVGADGRVVAAGFYQGAASALRLGEEFHHNRVRGDRLPDRSGAAAQARPLGRPTPSGHRRRPAVQGQSRRHRAGQPPLRRP